MTKWRQRYWGLIRWAVWYWRQRQRAAEPDARQRRLTWAAEDADRADVAAAAERRVLAALYEPGKRELP
jgi:hypothetical protein